jgi:hypothetical protein
MSARVKIQVFLMRCVEDGTENHIPKTLLGSRDGTQGQRKIAHCVSICLFSKLTALLQKHTHLGHLWRWNSHTAVQSWKWTQKDV